ncbi:hypothetical protein GCM10007977_051490 [Dactylosporangium sucinum]|uniref:Uncharacterized protein n=1 Tax=Dactylosporangium sucinum TaxID=1424081 RepID=A0A917WZC6_9ACTN|nr:hypothetical protein GCM10007977_051490 [Dactylosporangium sucinum]
MIVGNPAAGAAAGGVLAAAGGAGLADAAAVGAWDAGGAAVGVLAGLPPQAVSVAASAVRTATRRRSIRPA